MDSTKGSKRFRSFYKKSNWVTYTLQRRHGQSLGIHFFIWFLIVRRALKSLIWTRTRFQIFVPRLLIDSILYCVQCLFTLLSCIPLLKLQVLFSTKVDILFIIIGAIPIYTFKISIAKSWRLRWWIVTDLVVSDLRSETNGSRFESGC